MSILLVACHQENVIRKNYYPNGKLKSKILLEDGESHYYSYYETENIESEGGIDKNLERQGAWKYFNPDGSVSSFGKYNDNLKVGEWKYQLKDTAISIQWEAYVNRPVKINIPKGWLIVETLEAPNLFSAADDSAHLHLGVNISRTEKTHESLDSIVARGIQFFQEQYPASKQETAEAIINNVKARKVMLIAKMPDGKVMISNRYYLVEGNYVYLLSLFSLQHDMSKYYNQIAKEIALSFQVI
ncbi:toxin-antitoxin system YwqK family antitoxin [Chitinophaga sp. HK235]|uniref:toxin-antitoxin system YwqK family antitoxin n=1 Tax=Chitinophaga sp. HK235 TaxID=2952571 RepID=UPI001BA629CD|nr:hypothetical protein [Chitinophaga sp. HK235]